MITSEQLHETSAGTRLHMGRVTVTVRSKETNQHITLRLRCKNRDLKQRYINFDEAVIVACDVPAHGQSSGDMVGFVVVKGPNNAVRPNRGSDPARVWAFEKVWSYLLTGVLHPQMELRIEEYCGRCGRPLNDPISIDRGFGPECFGHVTGSKHQRREGAQSEQLELTTLLDS